MTDIKNSAVLLSTAYFPTIQYFTKLLSYSSVFIEAHENYSKQSYRNRCTILGANGPLDLSIPIKKEIALKTKIRDIRIDNETGWKKIHYRAIESAYRSSPFFIYYCDEIIPVFEKKADFLFDFNSELINVVKELAGLNVEVSFTNDFKAVSKPFDDFSESIHPKYRMKKPDKNFNPKSYYQVFNQKFGFVPNLSILDLLFNEGPNSYNILLQSLKSES